MRTYKDIKCNNSWDTFTTLSICFFMVSSEIKYVSMSLLKRLWKFLFFTTLLTIIISYFKLRWKTRHSACIYHTSVSDCSIYSFLFSIFYSSDLIFTYCARVYMCMLICLSSTFTWSIDHWSFSIALQIQLQSLFIIVDITRIYI